MEINLFSDLCKGFILSILYISVTEEQEFYIQNLIRYTMYYYILNILFLNIDVNRDLLITVFVSKCISVIIEDRMKTINEQKNLPDQEQYNSPVSNPSLGILHQSATTTPTLTSS
jgi:hypothetical protein